MDFSERLQLYLEGNMIDENDIEDINNIISLFNDKYNIQLCEENSSMFISHLCMSFFRSKNNEEVEKLSNEILDDIKSLDTYDKSLDILNDMEMVMSNKLDQPEKEYALLHINNLLNSLKEL